MSLEDRMLEAEHIVLDAIATHLGDKHELVASCVLFSGGNDSSVLMDLMSRLNIATHAIHANTTIGIEGTREFVRSRCRELGIPLLEETPPVSYADLVREQGFPGPAMHFKMYQRLKERGLRQARRKLVHNPRRQRVLFIAGRRRAESARRSDIPENERIGSTIWASPLADWTRDDLNAYREAYSVPRNPVADNLGMSGECLCGSFAEVGELDRIRALHPEVAAEIEALELELVVAGKVPEEKCMWGWGAYRGDEAPSQTGPLCSSCDFRSDPATRAGLTAEQQKNVVSVMERIHARRAAREQEQAA